MATTIRLITVPQKGSFIWISMTNNGHWVRNFLDFEPATPQAWIEYFTIVLPSLQTNANKVYSSIQSTVHFEMSVQRILMMISQGKVLYMMPFSFGRVWRSQTSCWNRCVPKAVLTSCFFHMFSIVYLPQIWMFYSMIFSVIDELFGSCSVEKLRLPFFI